MRVTCNSCGAKYTIADDKVRGRRVKVRCKGCGTPIVVDGNANDEPEAGSTDQRAAQPLSIPPPGKLPFEVDEGAPAPDGGAWSVNLSDTEQKDMTLDEIVAGWKAGKVTTDAFVWKDGMDGWKPVLDVPEIASRLPKPEPASSAAKPAAVAAKPAAAAAKPAAAAAKPAAARVAARPAADLFGRVEEAGGENETPLSAAGAAPYADHHDKATGARNENSVLFSLDSLKTAAAAAPAPSGAKPGPKPKPPAKRPGMASAPDDPFGMNLGGIGGIGGGSNALFGGDANALLTAPAPEPPPPPKPIAIVTETSSTVGVPIEAPKKSKKLFVGVGAGVAVLAVVGIVAMNGSKKNEEAAAESAAAALAAKPPEKKPEEKPAEPKPEDKPADTAAPAASASAAATAEEASKGAQASKGVSGTGAKTAKTEPEKTVVKEQPSAGVESFNTGAAKAALSASASQASSCKRPGGPTGSGKAVITFATSGRVTSANVAGAPFGGTAVGGCIASVFRRARVPAFSGAPVTVSKSFNISP